MAQTKSKTKSKSSDVKKDLRIKLYRGRAKADVRQGKVLDALGLGKSKSEVEHNDSPTIRGMLRKVAHMVEVTKN